MDGLFTIENLTALAMLIFLQAVLGFDNLLYISIESKRAPVADQARVRRNGILIAVGLRIVLLFVMLQLLSTFQEPFLTLDFPGLLTGEFNLGTIVFLIGGVFIIYTAMKEIMHMLAVKDLEHMEEREPKTAGQVITMIVIVNLIFSFDSILSAIAISEVFIILVIAILASGAAMLLLADRVAIFLQKNRMFEVLGLFVLLIVGVYLLGEGGHQAHMTIFGAPIVAMSKSTFYFSIIVMVLVDLAQSRYQKNLLRRKEHEIAHGVPPEVEAVKEG